MQQSTLTPETSSTPNASEQPMAESPASPPRTFQTRHLGPGPAETQAMLETLGYAGLDELSAAAVPENIHIEKPLHLPGAHSEREAIARLRNIASKNKLFRSYLGMGYHACFTPPVIQRNILENPGWYTAYTPYQPEIAQGRLEALLNFQTMVNDLTGMEISNASLLDEATAAAEAMTLCLSTASEGRNTLLVSETCHPQTIALLKTRASGVGIQVTVSNPADFKITPDVFAIIVQYPDTLGSVHDYTDLFEQAHQGGALAIAAADLLSLALLKPPGEMGADVVVGSTQRFGMPLCYGGPHAAFFATRDKFKRRMPGRLVGVSRDSSDRPAYRLSLQTREQHIRRDKATSNICTAQVLPAIVASMYAVYHGPDGLREIAGRIHSMAKTLVGALQDLGYHIQTSSYFDTITVQLTPDQNQSILEKTKNARVNLRHHGEKAVTIALDESVTFADILDLIKIFSGKESEGGESTFESEPKIDLGPLFRTSTFLTHPVFNNHRTETAFLRYLRRLELKDITLATSMIPLGSCTMKLNATTEMLPITWPEFCDLHPFAPSEQTEGYHLLFNQLETWLSDITGFHSVSLQPNSGAQGEYAGLMVIRAYHRSRGQAKRTVCLIPQSAHGTNPASAVMAGMKVVSVACVDGGIDLQDLKQKVETHREELAAIMITYPSTYGLFEASIKEICQIVHDANGQVYMDGANMNAQVGLCRPGDIGADVCHINLHKTFCIPHGGGGPGMGPIAVASHLAPFLPSHPEIPTRKPEAIGPVSAAPYGSPAILPISWAYIAMMGAEGLKHATQIAILNANYIAKRLDAYFPVLFKGPNGLVAHECIVDLRMWKNELGIEVEDVAKRLMDYGFHAPTMSWPVPGTMMIEPTESESKEELDRFCDTMISIFHEIEEIKTSGANPKNNLLKNAPHTAEVVASDSWNRPYSREKAAFPTSWVRENKFWPSVGRIDNVYGDRNLVCTCPPIEAYEEERNP